MGAIRSIVRWTDSERDDVYGYIRSLGIREEDFENRGVFKNAIVEAEAVCMNVRPRISARKSGAFNPKQEIEQYKIWLKNQKIPAKSIAESLTDKIQKSFQERASKASNSALREGHKPVSKPFKIPPESQTGSPADQFKRADQAAHDIAMSGSQLLKDSGESTPSDTKGSLNDALNQIGAYIEDQLALAKKNSTITGTVKVVGMNPQDMQDVLDKKLADLRIQINEDVRVVMEEQSAKTRKMIQAMHDSLMMYWNPSHKTDFVEEVKILSDALKADNLESEKLRRRQKVAIISSQPKHFHKIEQAVSGVDFEFITPSEAKGIGKDSKFDLVVATRLIDQSTNNRLKTVLEDRYTYVGHGTLPIIETIKERLNATVV